MWAIIVKIALGGFGILQSIGKGIAAGAKALNVQGWVGLGAGLLLGFLLIQQKGETRHWKKQSGQFEKLYRGEKLAFELTVSNYRAAAGKARAADAANVVRVVGEQKTINERTSHDFETRIAAARAAAADRLRNRATAANPSGGGTTPVSGLPAGAGGAAQAASEDRLSADDALTATEQAIQLDELIKWVKRQAGIDVNGTVKRPPGSAPH